MSSDLVEVKEAWELAEFETPADLTPPMPVRWSKEKYDAARLLALSGKNKRQTAKAMGLPIQVLEAWLKNAEFVQYMHELVEAYGKAVKNNNLMILNKMLQARLEQAEIDGYADLSRKDTLDIISEMRKETGEDKAAETNYMGLLEKLVNHSLSNQKPIIEIGGGGKK